VSFNPSWLEGSEKVVMEEVAARVSPLVSHPGRVVLTPRCVYFQPFNVVSSAPVLRFPLQAVVSAVSHPFRVQQISQGRIPYRVLCRAYEVLHEFPSQLATPLAIVPRQKMALE
jgi:hypothetical protein